MVTVSDLPETKIVFEVMRIVSEQSGVECACVCVLRVVQNFVVAYFTAPR